MAKPAISSLASANGPSMTRTWPPSTSTRAPGRARATPSPESSTPAIADSRMYSPMAAWASGDGLTPSSIAGVW